MQSIPLAVLKQHRLCRSSGHFQLHAIHTACGIETTMIETILENLDIACNPYRLRY